MQNDINVDQSVKSGTYSNVATLCSKPMPSSLVLGLWELHFYSSHYLFLCALDITVVTVTSTQGS